MAAPALTSNVSAQAPARETSSYSLTNLRRWSCTDDELPNVNKIKHLHVYDFDNTLFRSPLPNFNVWTPDTRRLLQGKDVFINGGWWHDPKVLEKTGAGIEIEEPKGWKDWWNERIVKLVKLGMESDETLNVLLTGRAEKGFADLVTRIAKSRNLKFHMICLQPRVGPASQTFSETMMFKQAFLDDLMNTYHEADEIRIYEDRPKHVDKFRSYFSGFNQRILESSLREDPMRKPIRSDVIAVREIAFNLDQVVEIAEVWRMINIHNEALRNDPGSLQQKFKPWRLVKEGKYTGYLISPEDSKRLLEAAKLPTTTSSDLVYRAFADAVKIYVRPNAPAEILKAAGGTGHKVRWRVTGFGHWEHKLWAFRVEPVKKEKTFTVNDTPNVVLACTKSTPLGEVRHIKDWQPVPGNKEVEFDTEVGEKYLLRLEVGFPTEQNRSATSNNKRPTHQHNQKYADEFPQLGAAPSQHSENRRPSGSNNHSYRGGNSHRGRGGHQRFDPRTGRSGGGRGASSGGRGMGNNASGRSRGRAGQGRPYRSLDDNPGNQAGRRRDQGHDGATDEHGLTY